MPGTVPVTGGEALAAEGSTGLPARRGKRRAVAASDRIVAEAIPFRVVSPAALRDRTDRMPPSTPLDWLGIRGWRRQGERGHRPTRKRLHRSRGLFWDTSGSLSSPLHVRRRCSWPVEVL